MSCSAFLRSVKFFGLARNNFSCLVDFRGRQSNGQIANSRCALSALPKGKNK